MNGLTELLARLHGTKGWRAWRRYADVRGNVLAGGVAYFAFFSLFPALLVGFTMLGLVVDDRTDLRSEVAGSINDTFGTTVIGTRSGEGLWTMDQLVKGDVLTTFGLVGLAVLLFSGLGWIGALRDGVSAVFGRSVGPHPVLSKLSDLGVLVGFGVSVVVSLVGSVLVTSTTGPVLDWLGLGRTAATGVFVSVLSALVLLAVDTALFVLLFRVLSGVRTTLDDVFTGALAGAVALGLLKLGGGILLRLVSSGNRFAAAASLVVGLLVWMNLAARFTLLAAAWAATTVTDRAPAPAADQAPAGTATPARTSSPTRAMPTFRPAPVPTYSARAADRTTLVAGAVLGVTAAVAARVLGQAGQALRGGSRRKDGDR